MQRLRALLDRLRSSLWFVPMVLVVGSVGLALALIEVDVGQEWAERWPRLFGAGAAGTRAMLSAIAGSMITVAGVVFSITVVALTLASSQYTSRILRTFMRDRWSQAVLGIFLGVYAYCLVVLRTIRGGDEGAFVPSVAVIVGVLLAFVAIGFLIFFIHHISSSIQATSIIKAAADETIAAIDRLFPHRLGEASDTGAAREIERETKHRCWQPIPAVRTGYVQGVDGPGLIGFARDRNALVRMECGVGEFIVESSPLVSLCCDEPLNEGAAAALDRIYSIGRQRTMVQDAGFGVRQIVDVALRALSPGSNDTTTAVTCVDYLTAVLARLAARDFESPYRMDEGELRVIARGPTFQSLLDEAFDQIRQNATGNVAILRVLLRAVEVVAGRTADAERRRALRRQAELIVEVAARTIPVMRDYESLEAVLKRLALLLGGELRRTSSVGT
ncbi:MAG: DUF2254 domain-containing protein [Candidatus Binatia bacterium]